MSTQAQVNANQANSQKSTGPSSGPGREASSRNRITFGVSQTGGHFFFLPNEREEQFVSLKGKLKLEHNPQTITETILVRRMAESEWLRARAQRLQVYCHDPENGTIRDPKQFALLLRYQSMHERAFYKAINELQKLRNERRKEEIGFVSQKRFAELHSMRKEAFEMKKSRFAPAPQPETKPTEAESRPETLEMAA
jgi:hypothetical protein